MRGGHAASHEVVATSNENRIGDHICYYSDLRKMQVALSRTGRSPEACRCIFEEIAKTWLERRHRSGKANE